MRDVTGPISSIRGSGPDKAQTSITSYARKLKVYTIFSKFNYDSFQKANNR